MSTDCETSPETPVLSSSLSQTPLRDTQESVTHSEIGTIWNTQASFGRNLTKSLFQVAKFALFRSETLKSIDNKVIDSEKATDGILWLRYRYDTLWREIAEHIDADRNGYCRVWDSYRNQLADLEKQLIQHVGEIRVTFKLVRTVQGWAIPGAYLKITYHSFLADEVINLQRDRSSGDFAVWTLRISQANFSGMLPIARLILMRRQLRRENQLIGICDTFLFPVGESVALPGLQPDPAERCPDLGSRSCHYIFRNPDHQQQSLKPSHPVAVIGAHLVWKPKTACIKNISWPWQQQISHASPASSS